ncbi:hypothetical protein QFC19_008976 [Naganishia cerealis]|uniref:Uncharacterized protein n=1 Tax=Naganishia cerealis TaxID=610337 RepID=A0ACC2UXQ9_9TREE|nr:hypothetical protein QFC19_008976 [Naganishia cerealis]
MDKLALMLFRSGKSSSFNQSQLRLPYDIAWRTQSWDLPATMFVPESSDRSIYAALRAIHRSRDVEETRRVVGNIEREEVISIQTFSLEDVHGLRKKMKELLSLREISRWCNVYLPMVNSEASSVDRYQSFLEVPAHIEPEMTEQIMSVRLSLIRSARQQDEWQLGDMVASRGRFLLQLERGCLQQLGLLARERKDLNGAIKILAEQQSLTAIDAADHVTEFAEVLWLQGDHGLAIDQLKNTLGVSGAAVKSSAEKGKSSLNPVVHSKILSRVGQWMAEAKQAHPEVIYKEYFVRSYEIIHGDGASPLPEEKALIYSRFACFTDQEYERILHLSELEQRHLVQQHWAFETKQSDVLAQNSRKGSTGLSARPKTQQGNSGLLGEHTIYKDFDAIKRQYLEFAIVMYARSMTYSEKYNDSVHRLCALWLANSADNQTNNGIKAWMLNVPTHKFAFLASQLTARLDAENDKSVFQEVLTFLLTKLCEQHPFHIMYQVITLARAVQSHTKTINSSRNGKPRGVNGRELAAFNLLTRIRSIPKRTAQISDMECFANASVSWCDYKQERGKVKEYQVPANAPLAGLKDLCIPVPTQHIPFDLTFSYARSYDKGPAFIQSYERTFTLAGGLHMPKIMFKNDDDLRQDSVMEQVFSLVNTLLLRDEATAKRELRFKTYTVLPLANSTGIIEFVPDSIGIGDWLGDAHKRYRPSDISPTEFRNDMRAIQQNRENPNPELIKRFVNNRAFFKPVMRHFFTDMRNDPIGEILHIDLGIAFDQGEDLGIPERVPFRLTADIIDGLGSFGLEGVYKRCCEQTLRLLREKADLILAVLEVFKHDPLQKWKADFDKVHKMQGGAAAKAHKNKMEAHASELATLALDRVRTKLLNTTSVEYTVNELIRIATDPANLATIFHGKMADVWQ